MIVCGACRAQIRPELHAPYPALGGRGPARHRQGMAEQERPPGDRARAGREELTHRALDEVTGPAGKTVEHLRTVLVDPPAARPARRFACHPQPGRGSPAAHQGRCRVYAVPYSCAPECSARGHRVNGGPPGSRTRSALDRPLDLTRRPLAQIRRLRGRTGLTLLRSSHCSRDLLRQFLRSPQTTPATAPRMITAPIAMNQVMMPKIAPIVPYVLLSEMIVSEK